MLPVDDPCGSMKIVYVPVVGSVTVLMNLPLVKTAVEDTSVELSGFRIET